MPGSRHPPQVAAWWPGAPGGAWEVLHDLVSGDGTLSVCSCWRWRPHWCVLTPGLTAAVTAGVGASACPECSLPHGGRRGERGPGHWAELSRVGLGAPAREVGRRVSLVGPASCRGVGVQGKF